MAELTRMAAQDSSSLVRLVLASTMQRMPFGQRLSVAAGLVTRKEDASDKNIPLMVLVRAHPHRRNRPIRPGGNRCDERVARNQQIRHPRLAEDISSQPGPLNAVVAAAVTRSAEFQSDVVDGLALGLQGQQNVAKPAAWDALSKTARASADAGLVARVRALDMLVGGAAGLDEARRIALDESAEPTARRGALQALIDRARARFATARRAADTRAGAPPVLPRQPWRSSTIPPLPRF